MKKRCLSLFLALALCLAYVPVTAYADLNMNVWPGW